jgi:hypothetical protein
MLSAALFLGVISPKGPFLYGMAQGRDRVDAGDSQGLRWIANTVEVVMIHRFYGARTKRIVQKQDGGTKHCQETTKCFATSLGPCKKSCVQLYSG